MNDTERAAGILRAGGLVSFPTETVYGLGADASNSDALRRLYAVKGRPVDHPVIVHLGSTQQLTEFAAAVPSIARVLADALWPGPLTLVLRRSARVPDEATGGLDTVGLRVPAHPIALQLLGAFDGGIAAPSANRFGKVSPTTADAVRSDLGDDVDLVLDGGPCAVGIESTIVDCSGSEPRVLREGGISAERLRDVLGFEVPVGGTVRAPGTLAVHYAPRARVELIEEELIFSAVADYIARGLRVGVIALGEAARSSGFVGSTSTTILAAPRDVAEYAHCLYGALRRADDLDLDVVLAVPPPDAGVGAAVADRLRRAAASG